MRGCSFSTTKYALTYFVRLQRCLFSAHMLAYNTLSGGRSQGIRKRPPTKIIHLQLYIFSIMLCMSAEELLWRDLRGDHISWVSCISCSAIRKSDESCGVWIANCNNFWQILLDKFVEGARVPSFALFLENLESVRRWSTVQNAFHLKMLAVCEELITLFMNQYDFAKIQSNYQINILKFATACISGPKGQTVNDKNFKFCWSNQEKLMVYIGICTEWI